MLSLGHGVHAVIVVKDLELLLNRSDMALADFESYFLHRKVE